MPCHVLTFGGLGLLSAAFIFSALSYGNFIELTQSIGICAQNLGNQNGFHHALWSVAHTCMQMESQVHDLLGWHLGMRDQGWPSDLSGSTTVLLEQRERGLIIEQGTASDSVSQ